MFFFLEQVGLDVWWLFLMPGGFLTAWYRGESECGSSMMCSDMGIRNSPKVFGDVSTPNLTVCFVSKSYMQI